MKPCTAWSGAHTSGVEVTQRTTDIEAAHTQGNRLTSEAGMLSSADLLTLSWLLNSRGCSARPGPAPVQTPQRSLQVTSTRSVLVWLGGEQSLWESPFLFVSKGWMAVQRLFHGRQIKLLKIFLRFLKNKILPLLWWEEQRQLGFHFYTDCK